MIYRVPTLNRASRERLAALDHLRTELYHDVTQPGPWLGTLRRVAQASAVESSVSIEGFIVPEGEALEIVTGKEAVPLDNENRMAVACYARAMDHVGVMAIDPVFRWADRVILDLHFDACYFQRDRAPGLWRTGPVAVTGPTGSLVYRGPDGDDVIPLMTEVVDWLETGDLEAHVVVRAAMAHLHLVSVHPLRDGNGRIARLVQSLVLAREGLFSPEFSSIEEYFGTHTEQYYETLRAVQAGRYQPGRSAARWVEFCIEAHLAQARTLLEQVEEAAVRWSALEAVVAERGWPDRLVIALEQSLVGGTDRTKYQVEADVSAPTASNDLRRLLDAGLVVQHGQARATRYTASDQLRSYLAASLTGRLPGQPVPRRRHVIRVDRVPAGVLVVLDGEPALLEQVTGLWPKPTSITGSFRPCPMKIGRPARPARSGCHPSTTGTKPENARIPAGLGRPPSSPVA